MYHLKLIKALSYTGIVKATRKNPDIFVEDKATADTAVATGYFELVGEVEDKADAGEVEQTAHLDREQLEGMKFDDLKRMATDMGIDIKGLKSKNDIVEAIVAVEVVPGPEVDEEENEVDYDEGSPAMIELQEK